MKDFIPEIILKYRQKSSRYDSDTLILIHIFRYARYVDGKSFQYDGTRSQDYCPTCKTAKVAPNSYPLHPPLLTRIKPIPF